MANNQKLNIKAIAIGCLVDIGCSVVLGVIFVIIYGIFLMQQGVSQDEIESILLNSSLVYIVSLALGLGCTLIGGFVCARIAKREEIKHAAIVGVAGILLGLLTSDGSEPMWFSIIAFTFSIPLAVAGGYIAYTKNRAIEAKVLIQR